MKILIITDAWFPQVNGVVTTLSNVAYQLRSKGHVVDIIEPSRFKIRIEIKQIVFIKFQNR